MLSLAWLVIVLVELTSGTTQLLTTACLHLLRTIGHVAAACPDRDQVGVIERERVRPAGLAAIKLAGASRKAIGVEAVSVGRRFAHGPRAVRDHGTAAPAGVD